MLCLNDIDSIIMDYISEIQKAEIGTSPCKIAIEVSSKFQLPIKQSLEIVTKQMWRGEYETQMGIQSKN